METTYFGNATPWYHGSPPGPWVMTDQENNLVGCVTASPNDKNCPELPSVTWEFVTATADGEPHHWRSMGGDARKGDLQVMYDGPRVRNDRSSYDPMRKQGAILLGNGGDNSNGSQGTFYEGAMTAGGTFPTKETNQRIQANVVAAGYGEPPLSLAPASAVDAPPRLQTFSPGSSQSTTVRFTNTTGAPARDVRLSLALPAGWTSVVAGSGGTSRTFAGPVAPGASVSATFQVTSGRAAFNGDMVGKASWTSATTGRTRAETATEKVRNVSPVRINEFRISAGSPGNSTDAFIELYNAGDREVDVSNFTLTEHPTQEPIFSSVKIPAGTKLAPHGFFLLGLANSGLAAPARRGDATLYVRSTDGMSVGDAVQIGTGPAAETRTIARIGTAAGLAAPPSRFPGGRPGPAGGATTVWQPLPDGPVITIPVGSTNVPVASVAGFEVGQKMAIGYGASQPTAANTVEKEEVVTVTSVGKPGTQARLSADAKAGDTSIRVSSAENISVGDRIRLDIASKGHGIETVTVTRVGTPPARNAPGGPARAPQDPGTRLDLAGPLKYDHASNIPFSVRGTGISFEPATAFAHSSNEPVLPLGTGITLDRPLTGDHAIDAVVRDAKVTTAGYQGARGADEGFGGAALGARAGAMVLRDAAGRVVDSQNYGGLVDPWAAEGYQAASGAGRDGCSVPAPDAGRQRFGPRSGPAAASPDRSAGRFPDGLDKDSNCTDFRVQVGSSLAAASAAGTRNVKVASVEGFAAGQKIVIDTEAGLESAVIAEVGTAGATTVDSATAAGATVLHVAGPSGFREGQTVTIDSGANQETAVVASISRGRGFGRGASFALTVAAPLARAHGVGAQVSGTGITLTAPLSRAHDSGAPLANGVPTPGAPNQYY
jgi:hypothetical protein